MSCSSCGDNNTNRNACNNPCGASQTNTPACESLPSQIQNFTVQFFGTVVKTEVDGQVVWSLPCSLDVGLPNNPRALDEGLACYFLRLFHDGIVGLTGPDGEEGEAGADGNNAYSVVLKSFAQPSPASPFVQVVTAATPAILVGMYIFIATSGWYQVIETDGSGVLLLTLVQAAPSPSATIAAGSLVVPSGFPGPQGIGVKGDKGDKGDQGDPGTVFTDTNNFYFAAAGTDFALQLVYGAVNFTLSAPALTLPATGTYLITAVIDVEGDTGVAATDFATFKLFNTNSATDVPGSEHSVAVIADLERKSVTLNVIYTTVANNVLVAVYGKASSASVINAIALRTTLSYVRLE